MPDTTPVSNTRDVHEQIAFLRSQKLIINDERFVEATLEYVNFFRLNAYCIYYQKDGIFTKCTTFEDVWNLYRFDRHLRLLVMDGMERVEIAVKTQIINLFSSRYGSLGYRDFCNFNNVQGSNSSEYEPEYCKLIERIDETIQNNQMLINKYSDYTKIPIWIAFEEVSFGTLCRFYGLMKNTDKQVIASKFGIDERVFSSWLKCLNVIRNKSAHHSRLWNISLSLKPKIPKQWNNIVNNNKIFVILTIIRHLLKIIIPKSGWNSRFRKLLSDFPSINISEMGFPEKFEQLDMWK